MSTSDRQWINRNRPIMRDWQVAHYHGQRSYFAQINESLALNVHRIRPDSPTWEWVIIGFDLTKTTNPLIMAMGTAGTMKEAKLYAENRIPSGTPTGGQQQIWPTANTEEVPF